MQAGLTLQEIIDRLGGRLLGDGLVTISRITTLDKAQAGDISFLTNSKYRSQLATTQAAALILGESDADASVLPRIVSDNPYAYFAKVSALLNPAPEVVPGIHPAAVIGIGVKIAASASVAATAVIGNGVVIGEGCSIGEGCVLGENVVIGARAKLYPRVVIYHGCTAGDDLIVHSGSVIGSDGFGIAMDAGRWVKIPQVGRVVIGNEVEIGANTTIDRGALGDTVIEDGVKLDNQIQIAHNVHIGAHTAIAGCAGIAGSAVIGRYCRIGGGARILGHLKLADHVEVAADTLVGKSIREAGSYVAIFPFSKHEDWLRNAVHLRHLDDMAQRIKALEQQIESMKGK